MCLFFLFLFCWLTVEVKFPQAFQFSKCFILCLFILCPLYLLIYHCEKWKCSVHFFLTPLNWRAGGKHPNSNSVISEAGWLKYQSCKSKFLASIYLDTLSFCFCCTCLKLHYLIYVLVWEQTWSAAKDLSGGDWTETFVCVFRRLLP